MCPSPNDPDLIGIVATKVKSSRECVGKSTCWKPARMGEPHLGTAGRVTGVLSARSLTARWPATADLSGGIAGLVFKCFKLCMPL